MQATRKRFFSTDNNGHSSFNGHASFNDLPLPLTMSPGQQSQSPPDSRSVPGRSFSATSAMSQSCNSPSTGIRRTRTRDFFKRSHVNNDLNHSYDYHLPYHSPTPYGNRSSSSSSNNSTTKQLVGIVGLFLLAILGISVYQHDVQLQEQLMAKNKELTAFAEHSDELEAKLNKLRQQTRFLNEKMEQLQDEPVPVDLETNRKLFHLQHSAQMMQNQIQATSKRLLLEKFGKGPTYFVEIKLLFDEESNVADHREDGDTIILETASIDQMPHAVYLFLEQVAHGLYDGTAFYRNAVHMVQAGPVTSEHQSHFRHEPSLNSVMFQEYNPDFPHQAYTVGYPGRPGGPDFYINVRDNNYVHGPGGQGSRNSPVMEADPCFAKVVRGFEAVDRLHKSKTEDSSSMHDVMEHPVLIKRMRIRHDSKRIQAESRDFDDTAK